jgi:hypothetical protein
MLVLDIICQELNQVTRRIGSCKQYNDGTTINYDQE